MSIKDEYLNPLTKRSPRKLRSSVAKIPNYLRHTFSFLLKFHRKKKKKTKTQSWPHTLPPVYCFTYIKLYNSSSSRSYFRYSFCTATWNSQLTSSTFLCLLSISYISYSSKVVGKWKTTKEVKFIIRTIHSNHSIIRMYPTELVKGLNTIIQTQFDAFSPLFSGHFPSLSSLLCYDGKKGKMINWGAELPVSSLLPLNIPKAVSFSFGGVWQTPINPFSDHHS